jgi:hypothetical protein
MATAAHAGLSCVVGLWSARSESIGQLLDASPGVVPPHESDARRSLKLAQHRRETAYGRWNSYGR